MDSLRKGLAMGADRAVLVSDDAAAGSDLVGTSYVLAAALEREEPDLVLFGQQSSDADGAVLWAAVADRLRRPMVSQVAELTVEGGDAHGQAPDRVRLRRDLGAAPGGRRRLRRDQRAALPVTEGDHGRQVEAAGRRRARRPRRGRRRGRRGRLADHRRSVAPPPGEERPGEDRRRRQRGREDRRVPRREEASDDRRSSSSSTTTGSSRRAGSVSSPRPRRSAATSPASSSAPASATWRRRRAHGASIVYVVEDAALAAPLPQPRVDALEAVVAASGAENVLFAASVLAADVAAGLAARLEAGLNWDLTDFASTAASSSARARRSGTRCSSRSAGRRRRGSAWFAPGRSTRRVGRHGGARAVAVTFQDFSTRRASSSRLQETSSGPSIEDADVIVAGGRGLGGPEGFSICEELAAALGGAVAATRAVVDAGWYPYSAQVGPDREVGLARSSTSRSGSRARSSTRSGMQGSGTIVAVNKDPNAPIFDFADFGVVGDLTRSRRS